jgi:MOSC domain-containing protein YiiM
MAQAREDGMNDSPARVSHIFISTERGAPMTALPESQIVTNWGLDGDRKARADSKRQVYLVDEGTLESVDLQPGDLNENLTVRGMDVNQLQAGQRVRIGDALLEITGPCTVCGVLEDVRPGLKEALRGRRGVLARVIEGGAARVGDELKVL